MAPHTPQRSARPDPAGARLGSLRGTGPRVGGPDMAPHTPQRSARPDPAGARLGFACRYRAPRCPPKLGVPRVCEPCRVASEPTLPGGRRDFVKAGMPRYRERCLLDDDEGAVAEADVDLQ